MQLRLPPEASGARRERRDPLLLLRSYEWVIEGDVENCFDQLVRYTNDFVVLVAGDRAHAERGAAAVLSPIGLRLSERKMTIAQIDEGFDFLGFPIRRHKKRGAASRHVYTYPSRAALRP